MKKLLAAFGILTAAGIALASPVLANNADDVYLDLLDSNNVTWASDAWMIGVGHAMCADLDEGTTPTQEALTFHRLNNQKTTGDISFFSAGLIVGAAVVAYCPSHRAELSSAT